ncbi:AAA family ATPase [Pseudoalteromonas sp. MB41]|uniref:ExeA family protein n=1 Tax=Pseudoalteromonas sp. MB41 TaxID=2896366 RepID=UPI001E4B7368|nr:AAA family ATPase [Pseudoalteromonas sp. MB41]MCC9662866.1 AAA family ATPase [Pseudoalteromonas sp. MB41]
MNEPNEHKKKISQKTWKIKLGRMMANRNITYKQLVQWLDLYADVKTSEATLNKIVTKSEFPKREKTREAVKRGLERYAIENGLVTESNVYQIYLDDPHSNAVTTGSQWKHSNKTRRLIIGHEDSINGHIVFETPEAKMLTPRARQHFKVLSDPWDNEIYSIDHVYLGTQQRYVIESIINCAKVGTLMAIVGECGSGKTVMMNFTIEEIRAKHPNIRVIRPARIDKKQIASNTISEAICRELNISKLPRSSEDRDAIIREELTRSCNAGNRHILLIDEGHRLDEETIKQLKVLWELSEGFTKLIGICIIGQTELDKVLNSMNVREFAYRVNKLQVPPLGTELKEYIDHKLKAANLVPEKVIEPAAIEKMQQALRGIRKFGRTTGRPDEMVDMSYPLNVNTLMKNLMNEAADVGEERITAELAEEYVRV